MQVIVEVLSGPAEGQKMTLKPPQKLRVGRTAWADFIFDEDEKMSSIHFAIICGDNHAIARDLDSTNGTMVNGDFIKEAELRDGDTIEAGRTSFSVKIVGASPTSLPTTVFDETRLPAQEEDVRIGYLPAVCESGLTLLRGATIGEEGQPQEPAQLLRILSHCFAQYLILDFKKGGLERPEDLPNPRALFGWIPEEISLDASPLILPPDEDYDFTDLVNEAWDGDCLVALYTAKEHDGEAFLHHLRQATRFNMRGVARGKSDEEPAGLLGYCWPGVLSQLLEFRDEEFTNNFLSDMVAVGLEVPDLPESWQLFGRRDLPGELANFGFHKLDPAEESEMGTEEGVDT